MTVGARPAGFLSFSPRQSVQLTHTGALKINIKREGVLKMEMPNWRTTEVRADRRAVGLREPLFKSDQKGFSGFTTCPTLRESTYKTTFGSTPDSQEQKSAAAVGTETKYCILVWLFPLCAEAADGSLRIWWLKHKLMVSNCLVSTVWAAADNVWCGNIFLANSDPLITMNHGWMAAQYLLLTMSVKAGF